MPPDDPTPVREAAPEEETLTGYDQQHLVTYLRLLDAERDEADWREVAEFVLGLDPMLEAERAHKVWRSHLERAHWMVRAGYRHLLQGGAPH